MKLLRFLDQKLEQYLLIGISVFLVLGVNIEIVKRYIFLHSSSIAEELFRFGMVWMAFIGVSYCIRHRKHMFCEIFPSSMNFRFLNGVLVFSEVLFLLFMLIMTYASLGYLQNLYEFEQVTLAMELPMWWFASVLLFSFILSCIRLLQVLVHDIRHFGEGRLGASGIENELGDQAHVLKNRSAAVKE